MAVTKASSRQWWATAIEELAALGSDRGVRTGDICWDETDAKFYSCTAVAAASSTWAATSAGGGTTIADGSNTGDLVYWNGSAWAPLAIGGAGNVLTSQGSGSAPTWDASAGWATAYEYDYTSEGSDITPSGGVMTVDSKSYLEINAADAATLQLTANTGIEIETVNGVTTNIEMWTSSARGPRFTFEIEQFVSGYSPADDVQILADCEWTFTSNSGYSMGGAGLTLLDQADNEKVGSTGGFIHAGMGEDTGGQNWAWARGGNASSTVQSYWRDSGTLARTCRVEWVKGKGLAYLGDAYSGGWPADSTYKFQQEQIIGWHSSLVGSQWWTESATSTNGPWKRAGFFYAGRSVSGTQITNLIVKRIKISTRTG